jgi:hypothetical protein
MRAMPVDDDLDRRSSPELHDLAVSRAKHHLDARFFWQLMRLLPAAEAGAGALAEAETDVMKLSAHVDDVAEAGRGEVADLLRPFYLEYLRRHWVTSPLATTTRSRRRLVGRDCSFRCSYVKRLMV